MKKNLLKNNVNDIKKLSLGIPKSINEALNFEGDDSLAYEEGATESPVPSSVGQAPQQGMDVAQFIDDIRKQSLRGMAQLAENPMSEEYQVLKKIWQIVDRMSEPKQDIKK